MKASARKLTVVLAATQLALAPLAQAAANAAGRAPGGYAPVRIALPGPGFVSGAWLNAMSDINAPGLNISQRLLLPSRMPVSINEFLDASPARRQAYADEARASISLELTRALDGAAAAIAAPGAAPQDQMMALSTDFRALVERYRPFLSEQDARRVEYTIREFKVGAAMSRIAMALSGSPLPAESLDDGVLGAPSAGAPVLAKAPAANSVSNDPASAPVPAIAPRSGGTARAAMPRMRLRAAGQFLRDAAWAAAFAALVFSPVASTALHEGGPAAWAARAALGWSLLKGTQTVLDMGYQFLVGILQLEGDRPFITQSGTRTPKELAAAARPIDLPALVREHRLLLIGEHHNEYGHTRAIVDSLAAMKRAGLTHIAIEGNSNPFLRPLSWLSPYHVQLEAMAKLLGIKLVFVDDPWADDETRNQIMTLNLAKILKENPSARVLFSVGTDHLESEDVGKRHWITTRLKAMGLPYHAVYSMRAEQGHWQLTDYLARDMVAAGLDKKAFYAPFPGNDGGLNAVMNFPEPAGSWRLPRLWSFLKRWAAALRQRLFPPPPSSPA